MKRVELKIENQIAIVTLNRPEKLNALDIEMFDEIISIGESIAENPELRVAVLHGAGRGFCAGMDIENFQNPSHPDLARPLSDRTHGIANKWQKATLVWRECPVPVIAAVHGIAYGGGLQILAGTDIKYVHPETKLSIMEMRWGIVPDMGGTQHWLQHIRLDVLKELVWTHDVFTGEEAVHYGFATHLSDNPLESALTLADKLVHKNPKAIMESKKLLNESMYQSLESGLMQESEAQDKIMRTENQMEAVFAQIMKRQPNFKNVR